MTLDTEAPVAIPETKERTDIGAAAALVPMRVLDTGAQVTILAIANDQVIKAPAIDHAVTIAKVIKAPEMTEAPEMIGGLVMIPTAVS